MWEKKPGGRHVNNDAHGESRQACWWFGLEDWQKGLREERVGQNHRILLDLVSPHQSFGWSY